MCSQGSIGVHIPDDDSICVLCDDVDVSITNVRQSHTETCLYRTPAALAIKGYPFMVLSAKILPLDHSLVKALILVDDQIKHIEEK